jgi:hypothetical protein
MGGFGEKKVHLNMGGRHTVYDFEFSADRPENYKG